MHAFPLTWRNCLLILGMAPLFAGCQIEPAGFLIDGGDHSLTVERKKPYFWSTGWELDLVVARYPECQRRYPLRKAGEKFRVDLYAVEPQIFILKQGKRWYVTETRECRMQQFETEPPEPGTLIGSFRVKNGRFEYVPSTEKKNSDAENDNNGAGTG
jgi:hypothetical protein